MDGEDQARSVVTSFGAGGASALSVQAVVERLIAEESWPARFVLLESDPRLVDGSVARWCDERGEGLLAAFIVRAAEVGVHAAGAEVPAALALLSIARDDAVEWSESIRVVREAAALVVGGASWLQPLILEVVDVLVARIGGRVEEAGAGEDVPAQLAELRDVVEPLLVSAAGCEQADVARIVTLARADWEKVWNALPTLTNSDAFERACGVARVVAWWFELDGRVAGRVQDVGNLVQAARRRGAETAVQEHRLVLRAQAAPVDDRVPEGERAEVCGAVARECGTYFQRTGAVWVLHAAVETGQASYRLTPEDHPHRAMYASNLSGLLAEAVQAGVVEPGALAEAVGYQREAYRLTPEGHPDRAMCASNLGIRLADAVQAGLMEPGVLAEAVGYQREAYRLTPEGHPHRAMYASNLGSLLAMAVQAGLVEPGLLAEAMGYQREAYRLTPEGHPDRAGYATNLGSLLATAVRAGVVEPGLLAEAVGYQREAYRLTPEGHPDRAGRVSNLGSLLGDAVEAGVVEPRLLAEAVGYQREACRLTPEDHLDRAGYSSNLGNLLAMAVEARLVEPGLLAEAVGYQREACRLTPEDHPSRAGRVSNLGSRLAEAVRAGVVEPGLLAEAVGYQREAYRQTPEGHPDRATYASNLGSRLAMAVQAGVVEPGALARVVGEAASLLDEVWRLARSGVTLTHRRRVLSMTGAVSRRLPLMLLWFAGPREAVRAVEALRGHLTGGMHAPQLPPGIVNPVLDTAYRQAASAYEAAQTRAREGIASYADAVPAATRLAELVEQIRATAADRGGFGGRPQFTDLCAGLPPNAAAIYLLPTPGPVTPSQVEEWPGAAVVVRGDGRTAQVALPELTSAAVLDNVRALLGGSTATQRVCAWLWQAVAAPLLAHGGQLLADASEWVVVPSGYLGLLPVHAAGSTQTGWLDDHVTVRVTSSLLALAERADATTASGSPAVAISGARDLAFLTADRAVALALIPDSAPVAEPVSADTVLEALIDAPVAVLSGHAVHSLAAGGGLDFGTEPNELEGPRRARWLTAEAVERLPLRDRDWAFLSACSSGQTATDLPDEAIGLPAAFRHAGFRTVIATTWPVQDHVAFIALARFLEHQAHHPQDTAAMALRQTRNWLRTATREHLAAWLDELAATVAIPGNLTEALLQWWTNCPDPTPYADPQDWAPYAATGH